MATKNPETPKDPETLELKQELGELERDVSISKFNRVLENIQIRKPISTYCTTSKSFEEKVNILQSKRLDINMRAEIGYFFDIETATCSIEKKNGKGVFHVKLKKKPETKILSVEAKILKEKKAVKMDELDDFGEKCVNTLKEEMVTEANKPENVKKAEESFKKEILSTLKATGFVNSKTIIKPEDVQDIIIEYEN